VTLRWTIALLGFALGGSAAPRQLAPPPRVPLAELVATLDGRYNSMQSWQADFVQLYTADLQSRRESGHLYLQKPGRMRWDYRQPVAKQFIVNGNRVWQYTAGDPTATLTQINDVNDLRTPLRYLLGHTQLERELDDLAYSALAPWISGDAVISGKPHQADVAGWSQVWFEVSPAYELDRIVIAGLDGSRNDIRLSHIQPNSRISSKWFVFTPPPGVRLVAGGQ